MKQVRTKVNKQVLKQVRTQVSKQVWDQLRNQVSKQVLSRVHNQFWTKLIFIEQIWEIGNFEFYETSPGKSLEPSLDQSLGTSQENSMLG